MAPVIPAPLWYLMVRNVLLRWVDWPGTFSWGDRARAGSSGNRIKVPASRLGCGDDARKTFRVFIWSAGIAPSLCHDRFASCGPVIIDL